MSLFLVTGGCGFIGSHLADALLAAGHRVRVLDDLSSGRRANLADAAELMVADIGDPAAVRAALRDVDGCFHLAAIASVERSARDWAAVHRVNQSATVLLLEEIRRLGRGTALPFVYASSAAVYGDAASMPAKEAGPARPRSAYGVDKLGCELHARVATDCFGVPTTGLRFFNVYGSRQAADSPYSGVISIFADRLSRGLPVSVHGDGAQTRDFVHVRDVVVALLAAMAAQDTTARVLNVCTGTPIDINGLLTLVAGLLSVTPVCDRQSARLGEVRHSVGCPAELRRCLGVVPKMSLVDGLRNLIAAAGSADQAA